MSSAIAFRKSGSFSPNRISFSNFAASCRARNSGW